MKDRKRRKGEVSDSENTNTEMYSTPMDQIQQQHQVQTPSAPQIKNEKSPIELQREDEVNPHISFPSLSNSKSDSSENSSRSRRRLFFLKPRIRLRPRSERPQEEENIASRTVQIVQHDAPISFVDTPRENHSTQLQRPIPRTPQRRESDNDVNNNTRDDNGWGQNFLDLLGFPPASRKHQRK